MTFDKPEHRELCRQMIQTSTFSGQLLDLVFEFKNAVEMAEIGCCCNRTTDAPATSTDAG